MIQSKFNEDINSFINKKKRKKKIKKTIMVTVIFIVAAIIFFTKAPIFNIEAIEFEGTSKINSERMNESLKSYQDKNIFTINKDEIKKILMVDNYIKDITIKRNGVSKLIISVVEESPVFYIKNDDSYKIINEEFQVIEEIEDISGRNYVEILGVDSGDFKVGDFITNDLTYKNILKKFYPYIAQNKENIKLESIEISDFVNIKLRIKNVEVIFGDISNIHEKMENIYRIMLSDEIKLTSGYIDVSFEGPPVIKRKSN